MAITLTLKGGEKDFPMIFDSSAEVPAGVLPQSSMEESQPRPEWHFGEGEDGAELTDAPYDDARWRLLVQLGPTDDWPTLLRELAALRRTVKQAHAHAAGKTWADEVYIEVRPDGAAAKTYCTVKLVEDRSGGFLSGAQVPNVMINSLAVTMTVEGDGYGDEEALANALRNGHMLIESATSGLASGLTDVDPGGAYLTTLTLDTDIWLIGGQSQKIQVDST